MMFKKLCLLFSMALILSSCASAVVGAGSTVALSTAQERTFDDAVDDTSIKVLINSLWMKESMELYSACNMTVSEGRVLITGVVKSEEVMENAVRLAWQVNGVKEVINEIIIDPAGKSVSQASLDTWIVTKIRTNLLFTKEVLSINYSIDVCCGNVYLIGIAQDQEELDRVIEIVRNTKSVNSVVNYVRIKEAEEVNRPSSF